MKAGAIYITLSAVTLLYRFTRFIRFRVHCHFGIFPTQACDIVFKLMWVGVTQIETERQRQRHGGIEEGPPQVYKGV